MKTKKARTLKKVPTIVEVVPAEEPSAGAPEKIAELKESYSQQAGELAPTKRKYTKRRSKEDEERDAKLQSLKSDFALFGGMILEVVCPRLPNPIPPTEQEKELFGNAVGRVIEKYAPQLGGYDVELALAFAVIVVFAPRMKRTSFNEATSHSDSRETGKREVNTGEENHSPVQ